MALTSLESTALALSTAAENVLRKPQTLGGKEIRDVLSDRVIAYALIAGPDGTILFHTNPRMAGMKLPVDDVKQHPAAGSPSGRRMTLGTGTPAYEFNFMLHRPEGQEELLRLILHTAEADLIIARAERMWWLIGILLALSWTAGLALERIATRYFRLQALMEEQKRLSLIGQMAALLAHEIRNTLASVKGYAQLINEKPPDPRSLKTATGVILQGTERMESLVNDLLVYARQEQYKTEIVDLRTLVDEAAESGLAGWRGKTEMEIESGQSVKADREKLYRALVNGMRNAAEAMAGEGTVRIVSSSDGRCVTLRIEDTGPGIPEEDVPRLFTPFYTTKTEGTGLGLAYAKKVVEGMNGRIELKNRKNNPGAVLTIRLPAY